MPPKPKAKPRVVARKGANPDPPPASEDPSPVASMGPPPPAVDAASDTLPDAPTAAPPEPVETKPIAPPKGRLDSLRGGRGGSTAVTPPAGKLKFKPKVVARKSKE